MRLEREIGKILSPVSTPRGLLSVLAEMGHLPPDPTDVLPDEIDNLITTARAVVRQIKTIQMLQSEGGNLSTQDALAILQLARDVWIAVADLGDLDVEDFAIEPFSTPGFWLEFASALPGFLIARYVRLYHPLPYELMEFLGLWHVAGQGYGLNLSQLNRFFSDPAPALRDLVINADGVIQLAGLISLIQRFTVLADMHGPTRKPLYQPDVDRREYDFRYVPPARPFGLGFMPSSLVQAGDLRVLLDTDEMGRSFLGLNMSSGQGIEAQLGAGFSFAANVQGGAQLGVVFDAVDGVSLLPDLPALQGQVSLIGAPEEPWRLFGFDDTAALTLGGIELSLLADLGTAEPELSARFALNGLNLKIDLAGSDSFLGRILPVEAIEADFDADVRWSSRTGLDIVEAGPPTVSIPSAISYPGFQISQIQLDFSPEDGAFHVNASAAIAANLGFMSATIDNIGVQASWIENPQGRGALGGLDLSLAFVPPNTIGLTIGTKDSPIRGGGLLHADHGTGQYDAILDLTIIDVDITAVAIVETRAFESNSWSMFMALFLELPGIPIGPGITLDGVGGLAGVHRSLDPEALLTAVRSGQLDNVLFPDQPILQAPMVIQSFQSLFPPAEGRYVFGPVVKLGFAKGLVTAELGVVVEVPDPVLLAVLGNVEVILPRRSSADAPTTPIAEGEEEDPPGSIVTLKLNVAGVFDFEAGTIAVDAALYDSTIAGFAVSGGMSLRAGYKSNPYFLFALGGFHPGFAQPVGFPVVPRLAMGLNVGGIVEIQMECYFAIASNTVQFGAALSLRADVFIFQIEGGFVFDALFGFDPIRVDIALDMFVAVRALGMDLLAVRLAGTARGPRPWEISGRVEVSVIGYKDGFELNYSNGASATALAQAAENVLGQIVDALARPDAWEVTGPADDAVMLADVAGWRPTARVRFAQQIAPFETVLDRHGDNTNITHARFELTLTVAGQLVEQAADDWFVPGMFRDLGATDQAKLSAPSFERMTSGRQVGDGIRAGTARAVDLDHKNARPRDPVLGLSDRDVPAPPVVPVQTIPDDFDLTTRDYLSGAVVVDTPVYVSGPAYTTVTPDLGILDNALTTSFMQASAEAARTDKVVVRPFELEVI